MDQKFENKPVFIGTHLEVFHEKKQNLIKLSVNSKECIIHIDLAKKEVDSLVEALNSLTNFTDEQEGLE